MLFATGLVFAIISLVDLRLVRTRVLSLLRLWLLVSTLWLLRRLAVTLTLRSDIVVRIAIIGN